MILFFIIVFITGNNFLISIPNVIAMNEIGTEKVFIKYILHE